MLDFEWVQDLSFSVVRAGWCKTRANRRVCRCVLQTRSTSVATDLVKLSAGGGRCRSSSQWCSDTLLLLNWFVVDALRKQERHGDGLRFIRCGFVSCAVNFTYLLGNIILLVLALLGSHRLRQDHVVVE